MKTALSFIAGASLLALVSSAGAQEPVKLSDVQMDRVTAGASVSFLATADAAAVGQALANLAGASTSYSATLADPIGVTGTPVAAAAAYNISAASSVYGLGFPSPNAATTSYSTATAALQ